MSSDDDFSYHGKNNGGPPPPPPPPGMPSRSTSSSPPEMHRNKGGKKKTARDDDMMQQELKNVLTIFREKRKIEIQRTPEVYVNQNSSEAEVQEWLNQKGFSERIRKQLSGMNGNELFSLKRSQLENYCGKEEGRRLDSQITISRTTSGFKTARSSELRAILAKARAKIEQSNFDNGSPVGGSSGGGGSGGSGGGRPNSSSPSNGSGRNVYSVPQKPVKGESSRNSTPAKNNERNKSRYDEDSDEEPDISFGLTDESDTDSDDNSNNKGTLGKMLKKKRGEILRK